MNIQKIIKYLPLIEFDSYGKEINASLIKELAKKWNMTYDDLIEEARKWNYPDAMNYVGPKSQLKSPPKIENDFVTPLIQLLKEKDAIKTNDIKKFETTTTNIMSALDSGGMNKGLVFAQVQSGKTMHYTFLIARALSSNFNNIVVLSSNQESLRKQTQERLELYLTGRNQLGKRIDNIEDLISKDAKNIEFMTGNNDYTLANGVHKEINAKEKNRIYVLKKNSKTLATFMKHAQKQGNWLIIDDEADYASINTKINKNERSKINECLISMIDDFNAKFLAYTATPFANILHNTKLEKTIIPEFIQYISPGKNYKGFNNFFIDEYNGLISFEGFDGTYSGDESVFPKFSNILLTFIIDSVIRINNGAKNVFMAINIHHYKEKHEEIKKEIIDALFYMSSWKSNTDKGKNILNAKISKILKKNFSHIKLSNHSNFLQKVGEAIDEIRQYKCVAMELNSKSQNKKQQIEEQNFANNKFKIAIGGYKFSRGITIQDLSFYVMDRSSKEYDVIMQQGRFFGYRKNMPTLYLSYDNLNKFHTVANATNDLINQITLGQSEDVESIREISIQLSDRLKPSSSSKVGEYIIEISPDQPLFGRRFKYGKMLKSQINHNKVTTQKFVKDTLNQQSWKRSNTYGKTIVWRVEKNRLISFMRELKLSDMSNNMIDRFEEILNSKKIEEYFVAIPNGEPDNPNSTFNDVLNERLNLKHQAKKQIKKINKYSTNQINILGLGQATDYFSESGDESRRKTARRTPDCLFLIYDILNNDEELSSNDNIFGFGFEIGGAESDLAHKVKQINKAISPSKYKIHN